MFVGDQTILSTSGLLGPSGACLPCVRALRNVSDSCNTSLACLVTRFIPNPPFIGPAGMPASDTYECAETIGLAVTSVGKCATGCHTEPARLHAQPHPTTHPGQRRTKRAPEPPFNYAASPINIILFVNECTV